MLNFISSEYLLLNIFFSRAVTAYRFNLKTGLIAFFFFYIGKDTDHCNVLYFFSLIVCSR